MMSYINLTNFYDDWLETGTGLLNPSFLAWVKKCSGGTADYC